MMPDLFTFAADQKEGRLINLAELQPVNNLKLIFREIRDYFAGNVTGITRDEKIAENIMRLLFCKIYDEKTSVGIVEFANRPNENVNRLQSRVNNLFDEVKESYPEVFERDEKIEIGPEDLSFIVSKLEDHSILQADRDVIGDAFEELIGTAFRGGEGQFFTPRNVIQMMIDILSPEAGERIIDPACGSGGFLAYTLRHYLSRNERDFYIAGIDKDRFLATIAKVYLSLIGGDDFHVYCENSLESPAKWSKDVKENIGYGKFDIVLTNPPFGAKIPVVGKQLLGQYQLGHRWQKQSGWAITDKLLDKQAPQVLFIERCLQLLREGGRLGIVLPEGVFGNPSDRYIWEYVSSVSSVIGVVSLPQETFQPSTHTKTSVLFLEKNRVRRNLFMAIANSVGHNKNGKPIFKTDADTGVEVLDDDVPAIAENYGTAGLWDQGKNASRLGFRIRYEDLADRIFVPKYYNPEIRKALEELEESGKYSLASVGDLIKDRVLQITRGDEIGSRFYGTGDVPFIRTSDVVNWEIKFDPIKCVAEEVYEEYKDFQDIRESDILFVSDGTFLIGRTAIVTRLDLKIIIQSHLKKIRVLKQNFIDPYYLFYLLNSKVVRRQIDSKSFVQATISTIGNRLNEVVLPISKDRDEIARVSSEIRAIIAQKAELREKTLSIVDNSV